MKEPDKDKDPDNSWIRGGINEQYVHVLYRDPSPAQPTLATYKLHSKLKLIKKSTCSYY